MLSVRRTRKFASRPDGLSEAGVRNPAELSPPPIPGTSTLSHGFRGFPSARPFNRRTPTTVTSTQAFFIGGEMDAGFETFSLCSRFGRSAAAQSTSAPVGRPAESRARLQSGSGGRAASWPSTGHSASGIRADATDRFRASECASQIWSKTSGPYRTSSGSISWKLSVS